MVVMLTTESMLGRLAAEHEQELLRLPGGPNHKLGGQAAEQAAVLDARVHGRPPLRTRAAPAGLPSSGLQTRKLPAAFSTCHRCALGASIRCPASRPRPFQLRSCAAALAPCQWKVRDVVHCIVNRGPDSHA